MERRGYRRYDSDFFFPILLITVGVIWMLVNSGVIAVENVYRLAPYWPLLLVAAGLSLLVRRIWWLLGALIWALLAGAVLWALIAVPQMLPRARTMEFQHMLLKEPIGQARSAEVVLDLSINSSKIHSFSGGENLVEADVYVPNDAILDTSGTETKTVRLHQEGNAGVQWFDFSWIGQNMQPWDIGLTTKIPLALSIDASTGSTNLDLTGVQLQELDIQASTGSMDVILPEGLERLPFKLDMSTGSMDIRVPDNTGFTMTAEGSTGSLSIDIPDGAGLRVEVVDDGPGSLNLPSGMDKISRGDDGDEGVYQNDAYATSDNPIDIRIDTSTGSVSIR